MTDHRRFGGLPVLLFVSLQNPAVLERRRAPAGNPGVLVVEVFRAAVAAHGAPVSVLCDNHGQPTRPRTHETPNP